MLIKRDIEPVSKSIRKTAEKLLPFFLKKRVFVTLFVLAFFIFNITFLTAVLLDNNGEFYRKIRSYAVTLDKVPEYLKFLPTQNGD